MKKLFIRSYIALYGASARQARKAWKTLDDGMRIAIVERI